MFRSVARLFVTVLSAIMLSSALGDIYRSQELSVGSPRVRLLKKTKNESAKVTKAPKAVKDGKSSKFPKATKAPKTVKDSKKGKIGKGKNSKGKGQISKGKGPKSKGKGENSKGKGQNSTGKGH